MTEEADPTRFAAALGMACFQAQSLEHALVTLFAVKFVHDEGKWVPQVRELMDERLKETLGKLIRSAVRELSLPSDLTADLEQALEQRNWVIHRFFREYGAAGLNPSLAREATQRLESVWPFLERTADKVHRLAIQRQVTVGRTEAQVRADIERALDKYLTGLQSSRSDAY